MMTLQTRLLTLLLSSLLNLVTGAARAALAQGLGAQDAVVDEGTRVSRVLGAVREAAIVTEGNEPWRAPCLQQLHALSKDSPRTGSLTPCCVTEVCIPLILHSLPYCLSLREKKDPQGQIMHRL